MTATFNGGMDERDRIILAALHENARISHARLAQMVNLSRNAVRQRIERLEMRGAILGYTLIRPRRQAQTIAAMIFVYRHDRMRGGDLIARLQAIPEVVACEILSGDFDVSVRLEAESPERIRKVWEAIAELPNVRDTVTAFVLSTPKAMRD